MKINLSSFYNFTISSLTEKILPRLTTRQKIISLIALAALASLILGYVVCCKVYKYVKKSDSQDKKVDIQNENKNNAQNIEKLEEDKLNGGNKKEQKLPQQEPEKGIPINEKQEKNLVQEPDNPLQDNLDNVFENILLKGQKEVPRQSEKKEKELKKEDLIRISYQQLFGGIDKNKWLNEAQIDLLAQNLKVSIKQGSDQKEFGNNNTSLFYVDYNGFGRENGIDAIKLEALIRYLILKGEVFAYSHARVGYCLYLNRESHDNRDHELHDICYTKQKLEKADAYVESLVFPLFDAYNEKERPVAEDIIKQIKNNHYRRVLDDRVQNQNCDLHLPFFPNRFLKQLMDNLVEQGLIHSWNVYQRIGTITAKIKLEDSIQEDISFQWQLWRDAQEIKREAQFRKENCVSVSIQALLRPGLSLGEQEDLQKLLEDLNKRTCPGVFKFRGKYQTNKILDFLKTENVIFDYQKKSFHHDYIIWVKETDQLDEEK